MATFKWLSAKSDASDSSSRMDAENVSAIIDALSKVCLNDGAPELSKYLSRVSQEVLNI